MDSELILTAQETFKRMLRDQIAPELRLLGFKGSGQNFALPSDSHYALLGFQKSAYSDKTKLSFTVNLTVVGRKEWEQGSRKAWPDLPFRPPQASWSLAPIVEPAFAGAYWHERLGLLIPGRLDRWWNVDAGEDTLDLAAAVVAEISEFAVPAMRQRMTRRLPTPARPAA